MRAKVIEETVRAEIGIDRMLRGERVGTRSLILFWSLALLGGLVIALSALVKIPLYPVPVTLQSFVVLAIALLFPPSMAAASVATYLLYGLVAPVFAVSGTTSLVLFGPTGGYLIGFLLAAFVVSSLYRTYRSALLAITLGTAIIYAVGILQLKAVTGLSWTAVLYSGGLLFLPGDFLKAVLLLGLIKAFQRNGSR